MIITDNAGTFNVSPATIGKVSGNLITVGDVVISVTELIALPEGYDLTLVAPAILPLSSDIGFTVRIAGDIAYVRSYTYTRN